MTCTTRAIKTVNEINDSVFIYLTAGHVFESGQNPKQKVALHLCIWTEVAERNILDLSVYEKQKQR